jgi:L-iditol 2-dehydrogenase
MASKMGKVCFFAGLPKDQPTVELDSNLLHYRQITVYGTFSSAPRHNALALEMIRSGKVSARDILTHVVTLDKIVDGMKLVKNRDALRVSVTPCIDEIGDEFKKLPGVKVVK